MGLGSMISGAAKIGSGALKSVTSALSGVGSSNWLPLAGSLAGGALGLAGGIYSANKSAQVANNVNLLNYKQAKEFAQNQIQWRVADAKKAGLHPLAALGMSPISGPPSAVGADVSGLGNGLSEMGQNISRSIDAMQSREDRLKEQAKQDALQRLQYHLQLERFKLDQTETASRVALNDARTALDKAQLKNLVNGASIRRGAQPRSSPMPKPKSKGKFTLPGFIGAPFAKAFPSAETAYLTNSGRVVVMPSEQFEQSGQNSWGVADAYWYLDHIIP